MKIVQINYGDVSGGAEKICYDLHNYLTLHQHQSTLYVEHKKSNLATVIELPPAASVWNIRESFNYSGQNVLSIPEHVIGLLKTKMMTERGIESCYTPASNALFRNLIGQTDLFHAHNLHGGYFDLNQLKVFSNQKPLVITLHDEWFLTGHCSYTLGCERWLSGCGKCPHLDTYPAVKRDGTRSGWRNKKNIFKKSKLYLAAPSNWLLERVKRSMVAPYELRLIRNGIDLQIYSPGDQAYSRQAAGLPENAFILLYIANKGKKNPFRDYTTVDEAIKKTTFNGRESAKILVVIGGTADQVEKSGDFTVVNVPYIQDPKKLAEYYRAADVALYATNADNYPTIILEAMSCGIAVVSTSVGGIPEQIQEGITGFCVPQQGSEPMARMIETLYADRDLAKTIGAQAASYAKINFGIERMGKNYLDWYEEIVADARGKNKG